MASQISGKNARLNVSGLQVVRAAALQPQTATAAIFNVVGGRVIITSFVGDVAVATPATTNTLAINGTPTSGTAVIWASATSTASKEVGTQLTLPGTVGGALGVATAGGGALPDTLYLANTGTITLTTTGSAATGTIRWVLTYVSLDDGAYVTAA